MKEIIVNSPKYGMHTILVDDEDFERVNRYKWHVHFRRGIFYASHGSGNGQSPISLHRFIIGVNDPKIHVDHKNHNGLDCQRQNVRPCTRTQNAMNRSRQKNNTTGFKGVHIQNYRRGAGTYSYIIAHIRVNRRLIRLGSFSTTNLAARAYDEAAKKYFGEYAVLNFPNEESLRAGI